MPTEFTLSIDAWSHGAPIPAKYAFGQPGEDGPFAFGGNVNPAISWSGAPEGTQSFALLIRDPDVPSIGDDVNQADRTVPADLPRVDFFHWVLVNIPADRNELPEGISSTGITARGKAVGDTDHGLTGANDYTSWFAGDADMKGNYGGYDGPCPPWNDSIKHHYHVELYALDVPTLDLSGPFTGRDVDKTLEGHVLAKATFMGTYSMNPDVPA